MNTSASGGYLLPVDGGAPSSEEQAFTRLLQGCIAGVTGLSGEFVRPRWQPVPPNQPEDGTDWCAFGVTGRSPDFDARVSVDATGTQTTVSRCVRLDVLCSFYGPGCFGYADRLGAGLALSQNRAALRRAGVAVVAAGAVQPAPALYNGRWRTKADVLLTLNWDVQHTYSVLSFIALPALAHTDHADPLLQSLGCFHPDFFNEG